MQILFIHSCGKARVSKRQSDHPPARRRAWPARAPPICRDTRCSMDGHFATALGFETSAASGAWRHLCEWRWGTSASGRYSVATGTDAVASGLGCRFGAGLHDEGGEPGETVVGRYNALASSPSEGSCGLTRTPSFPHIGIGVSNDNRGDAHSIQKRHRRGHRRRHHRHRNFVSPPSPPLSPLSPAPPSCCPCSTTNAEERVAILEQKLAALESAHADRRACGNTAATEKKLAASSRRRWRRSCMRAAQVRPYQGGVGRPPMSTPSPLAATALSLDDTVGNHTVR